MKFEMYVGTDYSTVKFIGNYLSMDYRVRDKFVRYFQRIGGQLTEGGNWIFPSFITSEVIREIIHNTCFVCGGLMKDSTAFKNEDIVEVPNGLSMTSHVFEGAGEAKQIKVRKCIACGHSHT